MGNPSFLFGVPPPNENGLLYAQAVFVVPVMNTQPFPPWLASEYPPAEPEKAFFHIIPAPFESSVSYGGGTRQGPEALLEASQQLEAWTSGHASPGEAGFYTAPAIACEGSAEDVLARIETSVSRALDCGAVPVLLGGEHTVTLGALRALAAGGGAPFGIVQIDAHADLRPEYEGNPLSHASVMHRAVADLHLPLAQFGTRDYCREEAEVRRRYGVVWRDADDLADNGLQGPLLPLNFPKALYVTFDVDGFDCSLMPATGTPSPGGLFWHEARRLLANAVSGRRIVGLDVVELAPIPGLHAANFTAAKLAHHLMGLALASRPRADGA